MALIFSEVSGQQWPQILQLILAFVFTSAIGAERQVRQKNAGLRTHALIGLGSALYTLTSKYGFSDVIETRRVVLDPSRIAAQIVSGLGFIGGGIIFKQENAVRGLTTAASVWLSAAIGMACAAGLPIIAALGFGLYLFAAIFYPKLLRLMTRLLSKAGETGVTSDAELLIRYQQGDGALEGIFRTLSESYFTVNSVKLIKTNDTIKDVLQNPHVHTFSEHDKAKSDSDVIIDRNLLHSIMAKQCTHDLILKVSGERTVDQLICRLSSTAHVISVSVLDDKAQEV